MEATRSKATAGIHGDQVNDCANQSRRFAVAHKACRLLDALVPAILDRTFKAGVREPAERLLGELIVAYAKGGEETRSAIRRMFAEYRSFAWAAALSTPRTSVEGLRQHLILFSMKDQGRDTRDALLTLQEIVRQADTAGVDKAAALREVAVMSSSTNRYGMGSTRDILLKFVNTL